MRANTPETRPYNWGGGGLAEDGSNKGMAADRSRWEGLLKTGVNTSKIELKESSWLRGNLDGVHGMGSVHQNSAFDSCSVMDALLTSMMLFLSPGLKS